MTQALINLKEQFFPRRVKRRLDYLLHEVKGSDLRRDLRHPDHRIQNHVRTFLNQAVKIMKAHDCRVVGRIWIKEPGKGLNPKSTYTYAIQDIARHFNHFLDERNSQGLILCDSRWHWQDIRVAHSVFTQKHKASGDVLPRILEVPVFGKSDNYAGLQFADMLASALLFPMAVRTYCAGRSSHDHPHFDFLLARLASPLKQLRYTYQDHRGRTRGGITVSDPHGKQPSSLLFNPPTPA